MDNKKQVTTGEVRLSYVHVFDKYASNPNQEAKYSVTLLIPKTDTATKARIDAAIAAAIEDGRSKWQGAVPPILAIPIHDGDGVRPSDGSAYGEECKGHWVMTASSKDYKPQLVDLQLQPIIDRAEIYSGCYARVCVSFFAYGGNNGIKKGIGCGLGPIQKTRDGEQLGGAAPRAEDVFGSGTPAAAAAVDPITGAAL